MQITRMQLKILLPFQVFVDESDIVRIVVETRQGSIGLLPRRRDCVASLVPGILIYETTSGNEVYIVVDEGILVKTGSEVLVSVRNAFIGTELGRLRRIVDHEYAHLNERESTIRSVMDKMESSLISRLAGFHHE
jgi:F-type H+-transporting ATPase subunit epsilon